MRLAATLATTLSLLILFLEAIVVEEEIETPSIPFCKMSFSFKVAGIDDGIELSTAVLDEA